MSFLESHTPSQRGGTVAVVGLIHGVVIYALVTGLAGVTHWIADTRIEGHNIPVETTVAVPTPHDPAKPKPHPLQPRSDKPAPQPTAAAQPDAGDRSDYPVPRPAEPDSGNGKGDAPSGGAATAVEPAIATPLGHPGDWATADDYPPSDLRLTHEGTSRFSLVVGTDGRVTACAITRSSGWPGLDGATCRLVTKRARFRAATDGAGAKVPGNYASAIRWMIPRD
jgi:protein TonB